MKPWVMTLLYKPSMGGTWQTVGMNKIKGAQVRRNTKSYRVLSGAFIGSSLGLGLGFAASKLLDLDSADYNESASAGIYPSAGAFAGLILGVGSTSIGNAPWDTYVPRLQENGNWRLVKMEL